MALLALAAVTASAQSPLRLTVAAVQFRSSFDVADNRARMAATLDSLAGKGVQVAVFPECALTGYRTAELPTRDFEGVLAAEEELRKLCARRRIAAVFGSIYKGKAGVYNTANVIDSRGQWVERYGKLYLAGEKWATPGNHIAFFDLEGAPSTVIVCHDERYPELVRLPALAGARVVYYISSESGLAQEKKLPGYRAQMMARAVENGVYAVAANTPANPRDLSGSHGQSRIVDVDGNVLREAGFFGEDILIETLAIAPRKLTRPLEGLLGAWWRQGLEAMLAGRSRALE
jgi:predicted amidohydrolase